MRDTHNTFIGRTFLRSVWAYDYEAFKGSQDEAELEKRLVQWAARADLKETSAEGPFVEEFFRRTWGYIHSGQDGADQTFTLYPKFPVPGAGAKGGPGEADLAVGHFAKSEKNPVPQVLCEFKDIKSALDAPQRSRKGGLSPVKQCLNYLSNARRGMFGTEPMLPLWGIVSDMNEFRLYWHDRSDQQYLKFIIRQPDLYSPGLLKPDGTLIHDDEARFDRFLFWKVFHRDTLITKGGKPLLVQLLEKQWVKERALEKTFYADYRGYRERLITTLIECNPTFPGTKGRIVRLAQKILDRCIFIFFCEDMGAALKFPAQLLRDYLIDRSKDPYFDQKGGNVWADLIRLFKIMNHGGAFGPGKDINAFNGGLFADDPELENLTVPNEVFCQHGQGQNEASLYAYKQTLLYLSASYNYAGGWAQGLTRPPVGDAVKDKADAVKADPSQSLGLYTLGHIFEQSITELEILEAEAEGRLSLNKEGKRKRDGVYYTPEWVVERIVAETLEPLLSDLKREAGWPSGRKLPNEAQIDAYRDRVERLKIVDPACGSGAFLITTLRYLLDELKTLQALRSEVTGRAPRRDEDALVRDILRTNIYGVDINPASVEIARLALWLHTARGDQPLSSLEETIKVGNSLISDDFYKGIQIDAYDVEEQERVNTFEWEVEFPGVFPGGFDAVVGNPPYVKLQNIRKVHSDVAEFIRNGRRAVGIPGYESAQTGNFDLYLPFIEKGLALLSQNGRLGFIAPSLWTMNDYGKGLRELITKGRHLDRWLDFRSFQIFEEATTYTALQFFTKSANEGVRVAYAPQGIIPDEPWADHESYLPYDKLAFGDRWLLVTGPERELISKLQQNCKTLGDPGFTSAIFVGLQTSADAIYHLKKEGPNSYICTPRGKNSLPPYEVAIEDALMKPLVSGAEAKRYQKPETDTYVLFPYENRGGRVELIPQTEMAHEYPLAWAYLKSFESELRKREATLEDDGNFRVDETGRPIHAPFNDDRWYRFGRHQGLDKQELPKLIVAQTVPSLRVTADFDGTFYLNNVRVNGIVATEGLNAYLLAVLNSRVADWVFRRIAKPKDGGWFEANKQFIAPLPVPKVDDGRLHEAADRAVRLQETHTELRDAISALQRRSIAAPKQTRPERFLFHHVAIAQFRIRDAPASLSKSEKRDWALRQHNAELDGLYEAIGKRLKPGAELSADLKDGELRFLVDGVPVIDKVFVSDDEGRFLLAQWKAIAGSFSITERTTGKQLCNSLRKLVVTDNKALIDQFIDLQQKVETLERSIAVQEAEMNALCYTLYGLTDEEIKMVERG